MTKFPNIPQLLVDKLDQQFPKKSPQIGETHEELIWRGGQRSVVDLLIRSLEDQRGEIDNV